MTNEKAIEVIRAECYVANPLDIDRAILVNTALDTAIKALEAADLDGYSSRLWKAAYERGKAEAEQTRWIPVSERLPELYIFVYATCHSLVDDREDWVIETCYVPIPKEYNSRRFSDWGNIPMLNYGEAEVIAWMERDIPEPYKAECEDKT